jgi:23S rRNA pseudouridine1911/1915/1917 synthase
VVGRWEGFSLLALWPRTGRQHQIRAQLEAAGHPVLGDKIYGPDEEHFLAHLEGRLSAEAKGALQLERHALHAATLVFRHPRTRRIVRADAPLPRDMQLFIERRGGIVARDKRPKASGALQPSGADGISPRL